MIPNLPGNESTDAYAYFIGTLMAAVFAVFLVSFINKKVFYTLRYKAPFYSFIFLMFLAYDWLTLKTGLLVLPYFPWVDQVLWAFISDRAYMAECTVNSLILLFTGYFTGAGLGLVTGVACGYNRRINYWIAPFMKLLGAIPSTTWLPVVMVLASTLFKGSVFIIALGVWFSVTIATQTGINNIDKSFFEAARTLGAKGSQLVFRIAIPFVMPNIFQGLTQGMSSACTALLVAEMIGVESGLGWYISWQKSWAQYGKMYAAIVLICVIFVVVNALLTFIRRRVLRWQERSCTRMSENILKLEHVSKSFARTDAADVTNALQDVSLEVRTGEFISIVGASGCGKSTILRLIAGLIMPTTGTLTLDGRPITGPAPERGMVFQKPTLFPWLTVEQNVSFSLRMMHNTEGMDDKVDRLVKMAGLEEFRTSYPHQLSGGMAQRVALIRTMINNPPVFLLDEPLGALDAFTRMNMQDELLGMWGESRHMMLMVTHDVDEALYMGTRVVIMAPRPGRVREDLKIELEYPRNRTSSKFMEYRKHVLEMLDFGRAEDEAE